MLSFHFFWISHIENNDRTLEKFFSCLKGEQKMGKIKQLFKQPDNALKLEICKQGLHKAAEVFRVCPMSFNPGALAEIHQVRVGGSMLSHMGQMKRDAKQQHDELIALLDAHSDLTSSDHSSVRCN
jgi:hypothetical protein